MRSFSFTPSNAARAFTSRNRSSGRSNVVRIHNYCALMRKHQLRAAGNAVESRALSPDAFSGRPPMRFLFPLAALALATAALAYDVPPPTGSSDIIDKNAKFELLYTRTAPIK